MYARLDDKKYLLRGWQGLPYAVVARRSGAAVFLDGETFSLFKFLDGCHDFDILPLVPAQEAALLELRKRGAVEVSDEPFPPGRPAPLDTYAVYPCRAVTGVHWSITGACNLRCRHCYISAPHYRFHDLDTAACLGFIDQMAAAGVVCVALSGGEPLTRADFWTLVDRLLEKGISIQSVFTNALLVDDAFLDEVERRALSCLFLVSFDGVGRHDWLRGVPGCEAKTVAALRRLVSRGHVVAVNTVLHAANIDSLLPTYTLLVDMGVDTWRLSPIGDVGEWLAAAASPASPEALPREVLWERYLDLARKVIADGQPLSVQMGSSFVIEKGPRGRRRIPAVKLSGTEAGLAAFACRICRVHPNLMPDGRLLPCAMMSGLDVGADMPNLLKTPLVEVFSHPELPFFSLASVTCADIVTANERCRDCVWRLECGGGCRAQPVMEGRGFRGYDAETCAFFREGWRERFRALL